MTLGTLLPSLVAAAVSVGVLWLVLWLVTRAIRRSAYRLQGRGGLDEGAHLAARLTRFVRRVFYLVAVLAATAVMLVGVGVGSAPVTLDQVFEWVRGPGFRLVIIAVSAYLVTQAVYFLVEHLQIFLSAGEASQTDLLERRKRVDTLGQLIRVGATVLVVGVAVMMALSLFNVDIRPILTGAGIAGLAVGFGAQNLVRDVIGGVFLILENQIRIGDVVEVNGKSGLVEEIRLRTLVLRGLDGTVHVIPNGGIAEMSNMTKDFAFAVLDVGIAYKENVDHVMAILREVGAAMQTDSEYGSSILEPMEILGVDAFAESAVVIKLRMKTVPIQQWYVARELRRRIKLAFDERGIEIPFPHVSMYVGEASKPFDVRVTQVEDEGTQP